jgi:hypothetical protein
MGNTAVAPRIGSGRFLNAVRASVETQCVGGNAFAPCALIVPQCRMAEIRLMVWLLAFNSANTFIVLFCLPQLSYAVSYC